MFAWLTSWFKKKDRFHVYYPEERLIYHYWNGKDFIAADPLPLYKKVMAVGPELSVDIKVSQSISKDASKAHENLISKLRDIFDVLPFTPGVGGLTEIETMGLLDDFLVFCETLKKNQNPTQTSAMATSAPSEPSSGGGPPTPSSSPSGSTSGEPSTSVPEPSPSEPVSPSVA